jgi:hypothetical protein
MEAVGFGIDGNDRTRGERTDKPTEAVFVGDEYGRR